jgi:hypothetical protein
VESQGASKIEIWLWLIWHNSIAIKDNTFKRGWTEDTKCKFCGGEESIHHLFFLCPAAKYMWSMASLSVGAEVRPGNFTQYFAWIVKFAKKNLTKYSCSWFDSSMLGFVKLRNRACFEKRLVRSPAEIICYTCLFWRYWAGL